MRRSRPESLLQKSVVRALRLMRAPNVVFFSVPNEGRRTLGAATELKQLGMRAGVSDLIIVIEGRAYFLELKSETGRQSHEQELFEADIVQAGATYGLAHSFDKAIEFLTSWRALRQGVKYG